MISDHAKVVVGAVEENSPLGHAKAVSARGIHRKNDKNRYFSHMRRRCSRACCNEPAVLTMSYQYATAIVWIDDLAELNDPHAYDLCERHGQRFAPPSGWRLEDRRNRFRVVLPSQLAG